MFALSEKVYIGTTFHITPSYIFCRPETEVLSGSFSRKQIDNFVHLRNNAHNGTISKKSAQKIRKCVNWLVASSKNKRVYSKELNKHVYFKINFITLTLPTTLHDVSDHYFKSVLLRQFLNVCSYQHQLRNYIWKVEAQHNGNIHAHITTDCWIHWLSIRRIWNTILAKNGLISAYQQKHKDLSFEAYLQLYPPTDNQTVADRKKAYNYGCLTNWSDPNSTDVHSVRKVKDLAAYMAKYMTKSESERRSIKGRLWAASYTITQALHANVYQDPTCDEKELCNVSEACEDRKTVESKPDYFGNTKRIGYLFIMSPDSWRKLRSGPVLQFYNDLRFCIRQGLVNSPLFNDFAPPPKPKKTLIPVHVSTHQPRNYIQTSFLSFIPKTPTNHDIFRESYYLTRAGKAIRSGG